MCLRERRLKIRPFAPSYSTLWNFFLALKQYREAQYVLVSSGVCDEEYAGRLTGRAMVIDKPVNDGENTFEDKLKKVLGRP